MYLWYERVDWAGSCILCKNLSNGQKLAHLRIIRVNEILEIHQTVLVVATFLHFAASPQHSYSHIREF